MLDIRKLHLVQADGGLPILAVNGSAAGESGASILNLQFQDGVHFSATPRLIWFQTSPPVQFDCRIAGRTLRHEAQADQLTICPAGAERSETGCRYFRECCDLYGFVETLLPKSRWMSRRTIWFAPPDEEKQDMTDLIDRTLRRLSKQLSGRLSMPSADSESLSPNRVAKRSCSGRAAGRRRKLWRGDGAVPPSA